ncbi:hypothetical protein [Sulfuriferula nivalis]|uniref:DUF4148 domain-containing protein n=1 Tax=Sulfuriferula nivalis TaxID=2675298 RepID=A0A809RCW2_9PROT|nr:hypothetical protein [Sulfuriferula nivalis]BBO99598.1 hypothetical protein SFSGTM_03070 [Sulfuriferula nivalis]
MNKFIGSGLLVIGFMGATSVYADNYHHQNNNQMQHHEAQRIKQGVQSGSLTREEAKGLVQNQKQIRTEERAYKSDGRYTPAERQDVHQDLQQSSGNIYQEKHDRARVPGQY